MVRKFRKALLAIAFAAISSSVPLLAVEELTIGSKAPPLNVEHWIQKDRLRYKPVTQFKEGKVYVVEFWATWCGPCRASMPHLAELQEKYADQVQIISISDEDLETVEAFLKTKVPKAKGAPADAQTKTYGELTSAYCLTTDPDGTSNKDYLEAASQNGIPAAFIVGKTQQIEWIGHPMEMDEPLQKVIEGKWDRDAFGAQFKEEQEMQKSMMKFSSLMQRGKAEEGLALLDSLVAKTTNEETKMQINSFRIQVIMQEKKLIEKLPAAVKETLAAAKGNPVFVNEIAWTLYEATAQGTLKDKGMLKIALAEAEASVGKAAADFKASMMDTIAHLHHELGDKKKALEIQRAAMAIATAEEKPNLQGFLDQLTEELKAGK